MNFRQIEIFVNVIRHGNFSQASKHLYITQPAISASMEALEKEMGTKLYYYRARKIEMTPAGQRFFKGALAIVGLMEQTARDVRESAPLEGVIRIAANHLPSILYLPDIIASFHLKHPDVRFQVAVLTRDQIIKMVSQGQYDIGIIGAPPQNDLFQRYCVWMDQMVLITPDNPPFQALPSELPLASLLELPLITRNLGNTANTLLDYALKEKNLQIKQNHVILDSNNNETVMRMVSHGLGAAIVSLSLAKQTPGIRVFELEGLKLWRNFYAIYLQVDYYPPYFAEFLKYMPSLNPKPDNPLDKHAWEL